MIRFLCLLLFCIPVAAQTIAPSQIKPGAENQVLTTIDGKGSWGTPTPSGVGTFNGRAGTVLPLTGDYACSMVTGAICTLPSLYNQTVQVSGTPATQEPSLNFMPGISGGPAGISCVDNSAAHSTDCTFSLGGGGGAPVCNLHGCYAVLATGTLIQWGTISGCGGGIHACNVPVFFPNAFSSTSGLSVSITEQGGGTNNFNATAAGVTPSGFYAQFASLVYTGGSGIDLNGTQTATWIAIGPGTGTGGPSAGGVLSINGVGGDFTFSGGGVSCSGTTCTFSSGSGSLPTAAAPGQIISSTAAGSTYGIQANIFFSQPGDTIASIEAECSTPCAYIVSSPQTITLAADHTLSANVWVSFLADGLWTVNGAHTLTFANTPTSDALTQHFAGSATVNGFSGAVPPEWFGAVAYSTSTLAGAGLSDTAKGQKVFTALSRGGYMSLQCGYYHMGGLVITQNSQGIIGKCALGVDATGVANPIATIVDTSASETILDAHGASSSVLLVSLFLKNFAVQRTVLPTGTARGISLDHLNVATVDSVSSADSIDLLWAHNAGNTSLINRFFGLWGVSSVSGGSYTTGTPHAINLDSSDGVGQDTLTINNSIVDCSHIPSVVSTGMLMNGTNISDVETNNFAEGSCSIGQDLENTGTGSLVGQDIQINNSILNVCGVACLKVNGVQSTSDIGPHVYVQGGNYFPTGTAAVGALFLSSSNIGMNGVEILTGGAGVLDISLNSVDGFAINNNSIDDIDFGAGVGISCLNSTHGTINANQIKKATSGTGIKNVGCTLVTEQGNSIAGNGGTPLGTGISFDSGSSNNGPWSLNNIDSATVTTPVSDAGTNNNPALVAGANITITGTWPNQTIAAAASGTGISGATAGQALIAGSATTATSSKALAGAGAGVVTGPTSATATDIPVYTSTTGGQVDSGVAIASLAPLASPTFTGTVSAPTIVATTNLLSPSFVAPASGTATSGANFGSGAYGAFGSYWTGTVSNTDSWSWANILGTGANPTSTLTFAHTGSAGVAAVAFPGVINLGVAGTSVGGVVMANATSGTVTLRPPTGALGSVTVTVPDATDTLVNLAGAQTLTNKSIASTEITGNPWSCQPGLGDGLNAITAGTYLTSTCRNETGRTVTLTAIRCVADAGSSTCNATNGAGTGLLTGSITGTSTYANGTQSGTTTIASGDFLKITYVADGTSKQIGIDIAGSY